MISYEIGTKTRMLDGRLSVEAAIYHSQYEDYKGLINLPIGVNIQNPGDAEIQGIEWSTQLKVNELMSLGFNANFTDTEFTKASTDPVVVLWVIHSITSQNTAIQSMRISTLTGLLPQRVCTY